jgi:hypothetical protein
LGLFFLKQTTKYETFVMADFGLSMALYRCQEDDDNDNGGDSE